jgi:hypothetical protein
MTLEQARCAFHSRSNKATAAAYMNALLESECDDEIGDDDFLDGLGEIAQWLDDSSDTPVIRGEE